MRMGRGACLTFAATLVCLQFSLGAVLTARLPDISSSKHLDIEDDIDNSLDGNMPVSSSYDKSWVKISRPPPKIVKHQFGTPVELECEASGTPAPVVTWLRDNKRITEFDDYENNAVIDVVAEGMARVISRLIINNVTPEDRSVFTCFAQAATKSDSADTEIFATQGPIARPRTLGGFLSLNRELMETPAAPRVVQYYASLLELQGRSVILPCKAVGHPRPIVHWFDNEDSPIIEGNGNSRVKILAGGELLIAGLRWSDMGGYTCVAKNSVGKDSVVTFLYPMADETLL